LFKCHRITELKSMSGCISQVINLRGKCLELSSGYYNQLDALFHFFQCIYFSTSTCFKWQALIIRREKLYQYILWYNTLARWLSDVLVRSFLPTSTSASNLASVLYQRMYWYNFSLLMMSACRFKHVEVEK
jgi:hypothetical protein